MSDLAGLMTIAVAFIVATASPGPATLGVATVSMHAGRKTGFVFGLGLSVGLGFWGLVAATGLGALLQASGIALSVLKILGGLYLLWLGWCAMQLAAGATENPVNIQVNRNHFYRGLLLNLSNPKAVFAWMAVLALGLGENNGTLQVILATALCVILGFVIYTCYALLFSTFGVMAVYRRIRRWINGLVSGLFALAGLGLIRSALTKQ